ncbi:MAG: WecB/TagA/CpsF family glycosyltransferase [Treponema sp.]
MAIIRSRLLTIPIDHLPEEDIEQTVLKLIAQDKPQHIVFLTLWDVLKARRNAEYREMIEQAALCLPLSKSILRALRFLKLPAPVRRDTFDVIIRILHVIDSHYKSLYLLGGYPQTVMEAEKNVRITFPKVHIVGRFGGYYHKHLEHDIITSIVKSHPSLIIVSHGMPGHIKWIHRNRKRLPNSIIMYSDTIIDIFAKRKKRISDTTFRKGHEFIPELLRNPFKIVYGFRYLLFVFLVLFYRLFREPAAPQPRYE